MIKHFQKEFNIGIRKVCSLATIFYMILWIISISGFNPLFSQDKTRNPAPWFLLMQDPNVSYFDVIQAFETQTRDLQPDQIQGYGKFQIYREMRRHLVDKNGFYDEKKYRDQVLSAKNNMAKSRNSNWQFKGMDLAPVLGPTENYTGRVDRIAFHPTDTMKMWVGAPSGGLWETKDNGQSWTTESDDWPNLGIGDIVIHPSNPDTMYVATGDADSWFFGAYGIRRSDDGGDSWTTFNTGLEDVVQIYRLIQDPIKTNILFCATEDGLFKSTDSGEQWARVPSLNGRVCDVEFKPDNPSILYACITTTQGLSFGETHSDFKSLAFDFEFYKSTDGGSSFSQKMLGFEATPEDDDDMFFGRIAVSPENPSIVYVGGYAEFADGFGAGTSNLYKSANSGDSFITVSSGTDIGNISGAWTMHLAVNPFNSDEVIIASVIARQSLDGGFTWNNLDFLHVDHHDIRWQPVSQKLYNCNDGGLERVLEDGVHQNIDGIWSTQYFQVDHSPGGSIFVGGCQDVGTHVNFNSIWTWVSGGDGMGCLVDPADSTTIYASAQLGLDIYKIKFNQDGTYNITSIFNQNKAAGQEATWVTKIKMHPYDNQILYTGYDDVWRSEDQGNSWTNLTAGIFSDTVDIVLIEISKSNPEHIYIIRGNGEFWRTVDAGENWENRSFAPAAFSSFEIHPEDPDKIWVSGWGIFESIDGGLSWTDISGNLPGGIFYQSVKFQPGTEDGLYTATGGILSVFYRDDNLGDWISFNTGLPNTSMAFGSLDIVPSNGKIRVGSWGRGMWESDTYTVNTDFLGVPPPPPVLEYVHCGSAVEMTVVAGSEFNDVEWYINNELIATTSESTYTGSIAGTYAARIVRDSKKSYLSNKVEFTPEIEELLGPDQVCEQSVAKFYLPDISQSVSYEWLIPEGWMGAFSDKGITVKSSGNPGEIKAYVDVGCGTRTFARNVSVMSSCQEISMDFDGVDDYLAIENGLLDGVSDYTVECWFYLEDYPASHYSLFDLGFDWNGRMFIKILSTQMQFQISNWDFDQEQWVGSAITIDEKPSLNEWHHVAISYHSSTAVGTLYLDGIQQASQVLNVEPKDIFLRSLLYIGRSHDYMNNTYFKGKLDDFRFYDIPRTGNQINDDRFCQLAGNESGLRAYLSFQDGIPDGDNVGKSHTLDLTSNGFDAKIIDMGLSGIASNFVTPSSPISDGCGFENNIFCQDDVLMINANPVENGVYHAKDYLSSMGLIANGTDITFKALNRISLLSNFQVQKGAVFQVSLEGCPDN